MIRRSLPRIRRSFLRSFLPSFLPSTRRFGARPAISAGFNRGLHCLFFSCAFLLPFRGGQASRKQRQVSDDVALGEAERQSESESETRSKRSVDG